MRRLRAWWIWPLAGAALVASGLVGQAGAVPAARVPGLPAVTSLQCPSITLCLGIAGDGVNRTGPNLVVSRAPRSGRWVMQTIDGGRPLRVLTCMSARWCLAVDRQNRVLISTEPARGAASWRLAPGGPGRHLDNVQQLSCPTVHMCVGLAGHYVVSSVTPQRGGTAWSQLLVNPDAPAFTVDCPATTQCVATNPDGQLLTSSDATGRTAWKVVRLDRSGQNLVSSSLSCASATQCVVAFGDGRVFSTTNLAESAPTWHQTQLGSSQLPERPAPLSVSCTTANVCAAAAGGSVWASPAPARSGQRRWRRVAIDAGTAAAGDVLNSVACVAGQLCVAVDRAGHVLSSRAITQPGSWRRQTISDPG
jgi:PQQ-like domain